MKVGDPVEFTVDAYPGRTFRGKVESLSPATGARFALLPPDNATGNFTKVVQRVPVRIAVEQPDSGPTPLRPGMSVENDDLYRLSHLHLCAAAAPSPPDRSRQGGVVH